MAILGEAYIRHILSIYSAYIGTRRKPRGKQVGNRWKTGGKQVEGKKQMTHAGCVCHLSELCFGELVFAYTAKRTNPISGKIFERSANITNVLCHTNKNLGGYYFKINN